MLHSLHAIYLSTLAAVLGIEYRLGKNTEGPGSIVELVLGFGAGILFGMAFILGGKRK